MPDQSAPAATGNDALSVNITYQQNPSACSLCFSRTGFAVRWRMPRRQHGARHERNYKDDNLTQ